MRCACVCVCVCVNLTVIIDKVYLQMIEEFLVGTLFVEDKRRVYPVGHILNVNNITGRILQ
jgi:hypothetical protein